MRGVDIFDQNSNYYIPRLRSRKWYVRVFFHLIEVAINNSFILYENFLKQNAINCPSRMEYRKNIIH
jgi:hypothetical protein